MNAAELIGEFSRKVGGIEFSPPVEYVYNPLEYAMPTHLRYWEKYAGMDRKALLLGMNPGPWGMAQTGVPFGDVELVAGWLGIIGPVGKPAAEHPKRKVEGFSCSRREVSGQRLWGWARDRFVTPEKFFSNFFVINYCPLMFLEEGGKNRTPDKLPGPERLKLEGLCDEHLRNTVELLRPSMVVGVGGYAHKAASRALLGIKVGVGRITHPSPANPAANKGWAKLVDSEIARLGVEMG